VTIIIINVNDTQNNTSATLFH